MAFQATPLGRKVTMMGIQNDVPVENVWHVKGISDPATLGELTDIGDVFTNWWDTVARANFHSSFSVDEFFIVDISAADGLFFSAVPSTPAGAAGSSVAAANAAIVSKWETGLSGRSFRGRTYWGAIPQVFITDAQHITTAAAAEYETQASSLIDALNTAGFALCVLSRIASGVLRVTGLLTEIISVFTNTKIDSQRRRTAN